ncbi:E3 ubiquitin-protein ligase SPL2 isoform X2 [Physcomitrium patens]|uniref:RING-type E3 ubiquitin transferase n=1 Tax=Physcomitrium patens TaxID=3218 RepID=A0A7I4AZX6_PHYPA|nr:E3 ubiquitin-protein ligase SPL2-like isoform X2 [Physcomitrium patens]|eukprot:XP_024398250.1 E3 ubiquitin-protein ligase SPL2-like isoform X2 [Physcomitrella patens]
MGSHDEEICVALTRIALAGDGVVLGLGMACLAVKAWLKYRTHEQALVAIKNTPLSHIADLRILLQRQTLNSDPEIVISNQYPRSIQMTEALASKQPARFGFRMWRKLDADLIKQERIVMVRGKIQTKASVEPSAVLNAEDLQGITPSQSDTKAVYLERIQTCLYNGSRSLFGWGSEWRGLVGWGSVKEQFVVARRKVAFVLASNSEECSSEPIAYIHVNMDVPKHPIPLLTVHHQFHPVSSSSYTLLQAIFGRRYPVGLLDEERILQMGREITAVGILDSTPDGKPVIKPCSGLPIFLTECTREQLLMELARGTKMLLWLGVIATTFSAGVLTYAVIKNWLRWKQHRQLEEQQRVNEERRQQRLMDEEEVENLVDVPEGELCVVCLLRRRRSAFIHCGHRVCCIVCARRVQQGADPRCPVCRQIVTSTMTVFDA